jgi:ribosomal subunit interface protein
MAFQNITFKHTNNETNSTIHEFVSQKLATLDKYVGDETDVRCEVEFEKINTQKSGLTCRAEVNIWLRGTLYRAEATQENFQAAVNIVRDELDHEMKKAHKKHHSLMRKGGRKIKEMMRFGVK